MNRTKAPLGTPPVAAERFGVDAAAGRTFDAAQRALLERMVATVRGELRVLEARTSEAFVALKLGAYGAVVVCEPAAPGVPSLFVEGGVAVRYNGKVSADLRQCLKIVHRHLHVLPGTAQWRPPDGGRRPEPEPEAPGAPEARHALPMMVMNGDLDSRPHDPAMRRLAELLWRPCPTLRLGHACNVACLYCCAGDDGARLEPVTELQRQVEALRRAGFRGIGYMGGEPTVHPGFLDVVRQAAAAGFETHVLVSNGLRLADRAFAEQTFQAGVDTVILSLDAFDEAVQERLFGGRVGYDKAVAGLHNVLAAPGVEVVVAAVVTALNAHLLPSYVDEVARLQQRYGKPVGILLHALQEPARQGPEQHSLQLALPRAAELVARALDRARAGGVAALVFSIPPCLLEGYEAFCVDRYATEWEIDLSTGLAVPCRRRGAETYWAPCASCPDVRHCPGVLTPYADDALRAILAARRPGPPAPFVRSPS